MPTRDDHLKLVDQFTAFLDRERPHLMTPPQIELAIAAAYYRSLHYIDAWLAIADLHPANDGERFAEMRDRDLRGVFPQYRNVKDRYNEALYQARKFTVYDLTEDILDSARGIRDIMSRKLGC